MSTTTKAGASIILALIAADQNVAQAFARAIQPQRDRPADEPGGCECMVCGCVFIGAEWHDKCAACVAEPTEPPDYSDEEPVRDDRFADCAAADWWAGRTGC